MSWHWSLACTDHISSPCELVHSDKCSPYGMEVLLQLVWGCNIAAADNTFSSFRYFPDEKSTTVRDDYVMCPAPMLQYAGQ